MPTRRCLLVRSAGLLLAPQLAGAAAWAQKPLDWPNRVVRIVVPVAAGGPTDTVARVLADQLSKIWGHQVVVENKGGAGTNLGNEMAARADPDGYTVLFATSSLAVNRSLYRSLITIRLRICCRSRSFPDFRFSCSCPTPRRPNRSWSSSPMRRRIPGRLHWLPLAPAARRIWPANCSDKWPRSTWRTFPIAAQRQRSTTSFPVGWTPISAAAR